MFALAIAAGAAAFGTAHFTATGPAACQRKVLEGVLQLHSFMYEDARATLREAQKAQPCPIAYWGEAMTYDHPLWDEQDATKALAALAKIPADAKLSPMERGLIDAANALYTGGREAWMQHLAHLHEALPADDEVSLFYALSLYANSETGKNVKRAMQAAAIAMDVFERNPNHPGAAHYLIHACDSPDHAILALKAARKYAQIAPAASHALHMPAHIFVQLGMWKDAAASNAAAFAASKRHDWHSFGWLAASRLELGGSDQVLEMMKEPDVPPAVRSQLGAMYIEATQSWKRADELLGDPAGYASLRVQLDAAALHGEDAEAEKLAPQLLKAPVRGKPDPLAPLVTAADLAQAHSMRDTGTMGAAIDATRALADAEDAAVSGPSFFTPAREVLGDLFLRAHRFVEAEREFRKALDVRPNRLNALRGLSEAARGAGDARLAQDAQARLAAQVR